MMSFSKHAKGFPSSSDGHHFVRNMHEFHRENRFFFVMFWGTCPIGLLTGMNDSSQATMDSPVTIGRGIIWTLQWRCQWSALRPWPSHSMCSNPHWQVGQSPGRSWFHEILTRANGNKGDITVSRFREKLFPANWVQRVTTISWKISRSWAQKNGVQHATALYPIPRYTRPRYIG